jgi:hypothetical protein
MNTKICTKCKIEKNINDFSDLWKKLKSEKWVINGKRAECKKCANERRKHCYLKDYRTGLLSNAKQRSRINNIECTITLEDIIIPEICPILKVPLIRGTKNNYKFSPTIDRIDSTKGYTKDNIKVISMKANTMKNNATFNELKIFSENIMNYLNDDIV